MLSLSFRRTLVFLCLLAIITSCEKPVKDVFPEFVFTHHVDGNLLQKGATIYINKAGNPYGIDELQYFISEVTLKTTDGKLIPILTDNAIHYVDIDIPSTLSWKPKDLLPVSEYASISFVFGINEVKNKSGIFVNPPERDMFWPDMMGGGYHYMKMNGKWTTNGMAITPFNFHLGVGMNTDGVSFTQNYFTVTLPLNIHAGSLKNVFTITMNIEKWFEAPHMWNWDSIGGQIMQNQDAMKKACENGLNAFSVSHVGEDIVYHD